MLLISGLIVCVNRVPVVRKVVKRKGFHRIERTALSDKSWIVGNLLGNPWPRGPRTYQYLHHGEMNAQVNPVTWYSPLDNDGCTRVVAVCRLPQTLCLCTDLTGDNCRADIRL